MIVSKNVLQLAALRVRFRLGFLIFRYVQYSQDVLSAIHLCIATNIWSPLVGFVKEQERGSGTPNLHPFYCHPAEGRNGVPPYLPIFYFRLALFAISVTVFSSVLFLVGSQ